MPWVRIDEHALNHVKILALSHGAFRLWVEGLAHCQKHLTDGKITRNDLKTFRYVSRARVDQLLQSLWRSVEDGFEVNDYLIWNESRAAVLLARSKAQTRMAKLRDGSPERTPNTRRTNGVGAGEVRLSTPLPRTQKTKEKTVEDDCAAMETPIASPTAPRSAPELCGLPALREGLDLRVRSEDGSVLLTFPTQGHQGEWDLTRDQVAEWQQLYPGLDVMDECRHALAWAQADRKRRKSAKGMPRFLVNWFTRSVDRRGPSGNGQSPLLGVKSKLTQALEKASEGW